MKPKVSRRNKVIIRVEINKMETKKTIEKINKTKSWFFKKIQKTDYWYQRGRGWGSMK